MWRQRPSMFGFAIKFSKGGRTPDWSWLISLTSVKPSPTANTGIMWSRIGMSLIAFWLWWTAQVLTQTFSNSSKTTTKSWRISPPSFWEKVGRSIRRWYYRRDPFANHRDLWQYWLPIYSTRGGKWRRKQAKNRQRGRIDDGIYLIIREKRFTYVKAGSIDDLEQLGVLKYRDFMDKIGLSNYGKAKWLKMKLEDQKKAVSEFLKDPKKREDEIACTNFNSFLCETTTDSCKIGWHRIESNQLRIRRRRGDFCSPREVQVDRAYRHHWRAEREILGSLSRLRRQGL